MGRKPHPPRKRESLTVHLTPSLAQHLRAEAARLQTSISSLVEQYLHRAVEEEAASVYDRIAAGVEAAVGRGILRMANRVAYLTATAALEATTARILAATLSSMPTR